MTPIPCQRDLFAIPRDIAYLNCAYMAPLARPVLAALEEGAARKAAPWTYKPADFFAYSEHSRERFAALLGSSPDDIAIVPSASYGLEVAARNLPVARGQEILVLADQFPSNLYCWRALAEQTGAVIRTVERDPASNWTPAVLGAIGADTAIVAIPHCHWADGMLADPVAIGAACRANGAALVMDLTQSLGALPFPLAEAQPDFVVAASYKWQLGPYGIGLLYAAPKHQQGEPIEHNWINRAGSEDFARLVDYRDDFQPGARRYDMGEKSNPPLLAAVSASIDLLLGWGVDRIAAQLGAATAGLAERAAPLGLVAADPALRAPHFLSLAFPDGVPAGITEALAARQVHVSLRGSSLRVTPHLYNDAEDSDRLIEALAAVLR